MSGVTAFQPAARFDGYVMRSARPGDCERVTALCSRAWPHGEDYVPAAWDEWLADAQGELLVVEQGADLAAVAKVTMLAEHEGWLEGLRVDPGHRGRGLAGWILGTCLERARGLGATVVRLGTGADNAAVHKTAARHGMVRIASFLYYSAQPLPGAVAPLPLTSADAAQARELLRASSELAAAGGLFETFWCWPELSDERLAALVEAGQAFAARDHAGRLAALAIVPDARLGERAGGLLIGLLAGELAATAELARGLRGLAAERGMDHVEAKLPGPAQLREAAVAAGYAPEEGFEIWVFEKRFP